MVVNVPHPSREERAVLELAQVEGDEERPGHENQREQRSVRLISDLPRPRAVALTLCDVPFCDVEGATLQRVLLENLPSDTEG